MSLFTNCSWCLLLYYCNCFSGLPRPVTRIGISAFPSRESQVAPPIGDQGADVSRCLLHSIPSTTSANGLTETNRTSQVPISRCTVPARWTQGAAPSSHLEREREREREREVGSCVVSHCIAIRPRFTRSHMPINHVIYQLMTHPAAICIHFPCTAAQ